MNGSSNQKLAYVNGAFVDEEQARVHVTDLGIQRGYGVFDYLRIKDGSPLYLPDHLQRFFRSATEMRLSGSLTIEGLTGIIGDLIKRNELSEAGIRLTLTGGRSPDSYSIGEPCLIVTSSPLQMPTDDLFTKGIRLMTYEHRRQLPKIKTIDYLMPVYLQPKIRAAKADDVLYHNNGKLSECPRANIFIVKGNDVFTPSDDVLEGITRKHILDLKTGGLRMISRDVYLSDLAKADEVFVTSTTKAVLPVSAVDNMSFGTPGRATKMILEALRTSQL